ncbi:response regulator [Lacrimispora brassicae]
MKVIIAEDEYYAKKMLVKLLTDINMDITVCLEAETGKQAADYLAGKEADLVITDIRMPEMDGLSLAKYVEENCPVTDVIIVSGYSDFNYAREAMKYGVRYYLTKPVKPEELEKAIWDITKTREDKRRLLEKQVDLRLLQESLQYVNISGILANKALMDTFRDLCGGQLKDLSYQMLLLQGKQRMSREDAKRLAEFLESASDHTNIQVFYFQQPDEVIAMNFGRQEMLTDKKLLLRLKQELPQWELEITCGISRIYKGEELLGDAYRDCVYAINGRLLEEKNRVFEYESELSMEQILTQQEELAIYESVMKGSYPQAEAALCQFFERCRSGSWNVYSLYSGIMQIFSVISRAYCSREASTESEEVNRYLLFSFKSDLYQFRTRQELLRYMLKILENTCGSQEGKGSIIEEIKNYVSLNFRYEISLNELAAHKYFMNSSYLSRLFKSETGMNFSKYLITYRMERAKELLKNTVFKINEIADYVGYNDTSYFIHTFKRLYQITPEQYRAQEEKR